MAAKFLSFNQELNEAVDLKDWVKEEPVPDEPLPLRYVWHVWEQVQQDDRSKEYSDNTRDLAAFDTVQKFWQLWSFIPQPSELLDHKRMVRQDKNGRSHVVDAVMIFKEGIKPMWEDPRNATGGHFEYRLSFPQMSAGQIDEYWNNLVLGLIGSTVEGSDHITGVRLVDKLSQGRHSCIRIEVWYSKLPSREVQDSLLKEINRCMATKIDGSVGTLPRADVKSHGK
ncbi:UNVERIFIED_CONTAM: eukaryotic initiation factor-4E, putative [Hammondia hammondi]|eukprot:XP_008881725.1 eukaryotic initiation factor-4E, putative [Hammondia hammondi]